MSVEKYQSFTPQGTVLTTELNSLADATFSAPSAAYDNSSNLDRFGVFELGVTFGSAPTAYSVVDIYAIMAPDGSTYGSGNATLPPSPRQLLGSFVVPNNAGPLVLHSELCEIPPSKFKVQVQNRTGQAMTSSGNTVKLFTTNLATS